MDNLIGVSTGAVYSWVETPDEEINIVKKLDSDCVEVIFATPAEVDKGLSDLSIKYLLSKEVTIHAPFFGGCKRQDFMYFNNDRTKGMLVRLSELYKKINAKGIVVHTNLVNDWSVFDGYRMKILVENMQKDRGFTVDKMAQILENHPEYSMVLDTAHALSHGVEHMNELAERFESRIAHVHLSDRRYVPEKQKIKDHQGLCECSDVSQFYGLKKLKCPIVVEVNLDLKPNDIGALKAEIDFARNFFKPMR